jgi:hypothetical protein
LVADKKKSKTFTSEGYGKELVKEKSIGRVKKR